MTAHEPLRRAVAGWHDFWFAPQPHTVLDLIRLGVGLALLGLYGALGADLFALYAVDGWVDVAAAHELQPPGWAAMAWAWLPPGWPQQMALGVFVGAIVAFTLGWHTRMVKWPVWLGHLALVDVNPVVTYGVDNILASLLFLLALAPIGQTLSLDRWRRVRAVKRVDLRATCPVPRSARAGVVLRLIQIQLVVFFFIAGAAKLQGDSWWHGLAVWYALTNHEYTNIPIGWLADQFWLVNVLTYATIVLELAYPFLIWGPRRGWMLAAAIALHLGIAAMLGLYAFSLVMIAAHLAFLRPAWLARAAAAWRARVGGIEMIVDGRCAFCLRSMAAFLAFDGLGQIRVCDFRSDPSPVVDSALLEKALYLVTEDGRAIPGFDAYRHAVLRVPGLWWMVPLFYLPLLSRAVGRPVYDWIASHRHVISTCGVTAAVRGADAAPDARR